MPFCSSRRIQKRTSKRERDRKRESEDGEDEKKKHDKKMDLCKVPGVTFLWNKKKTTKKDLSVFIFYFQLQSLFPFFLWCVSKMAICMLI